MNPAIAKFVQLQERGQELKAWFTNFLEHKNRGFSLRVLPSGDFGVWEWAGQNMEMPSDKALDLGAFFVGLRSCLDIALYRVSQEAIAEGRTRPKNIRFPVLQHEEKWRPSTVSWLSKEDRQKVLRAQYFGDRRNYSINVWLVNEFAICDKHYSLLQLEMGTTGWGQMGSKHGIPFSWAMDLGLGEPDSEGWYPISKVHGLSSNRLEDGEVVIEGALGGLAVSGTLPMLDLRFADGLVLNAECSEKPLSMMSIVEAIDQATWEIRDILSILTGAITMVSDEEINATNMVNHEQRLDWAQRAIQIYLHIPKDKSVRPNWLMRLDELPLGSHNLSE